MSGNFSCGNRSVSDFKLTEVATTHLYVPILLACASVVGLKINLSV